MSGMMTSRTMNTVATKSAAGVRHSARRRLRRAFMEAGVVLSLTLAIVAVLCMFGLQKVSAFELTSVPGDDTRIAVGAVLLSLFVGLCGLTSFMLRDTLQNTRREGMSGRQG
jgi:hypothetical protein